MTNWEENIAAPESLFRPELNQCTPTTDLDYWFILTELLTGKENVPGVVPSRNSISLRFAYIYLRDLFGTYITVRKSCGQNTRMY